MIFTPYTFTGQKAQLRYDPNAAQLRYAAPGVLFPDLGMVSANADVSQIYRGGGVGNIYPNPLTFNQPTSGSFQTNSSGSKWLNEGYRGAVAVTGTNALYAGVTDARFNLGASNFTMEFWVNPSTTTMRPFFNNYRSYQVTTTSMGWFTGANTFSLYIESGGNEFGIWVGRSFTVPIGQWSHVALTRTGNEYRCFINGVQQGTTVTQAGTINNSTTWPTYIGNYNNTAQSAATYQDARIYVGVSKYPTSASFTPPPNMVIAP
jgi:hypothetical protein